MNEAPAASGLPGIVSDFEVDARTREQFDLQGYVKLRGVLDPVALTAWAPVITSAVIDLNTEDLPLAERDTYGRAFLQVSNLWRERDAVVPFVTSPDLARIAAALLGVESVRLYHDQALYKEPSGGITPWHADQYYWPFDSDRCVTVWIPLQDTADDMGPLTFAVGSHTFVSGRDLPISDESEARLQEGLSAADYTIDATPYRLGDISFHLGWTFHRAGENRSAHPRRVMTMIYVDAAVTITEPTNENQVVDLGRWMPGQVPGEVVASPLNPVLHPA